MEHTAVEPFEGHISLDRHTPLTRQFESSIGAALDQSFDFILHIPAKAFDGVKADQVKASLEALEQWVKGTASQLPLALPGKMPTGRFEPPGVPFGVIFRRHPPVFETGIFIMLFLVGDELEDDRAERVRRAVKKKRSKLAWWKEHFSARTVLVLEANDMQVSNSGVIAKALHRAEQGERDLPDEVHLVMTGIDQVWLGTALRIDNRRYPLTADRSGKLIFEVWPSALATLTGH